VQVKEISDEIWHKVTKTPMITYYSPERVFIYLHLQKQGLKLELFTSGESIEGVKNLEYKRGGAKWGVLYITDTAQLEKTIPAIKRSYGLIKDAIRNNEPTGWYADSELESNEDDERTAPNDAL